MRISAEGAAAGPALGYRPDVLAPYRDVLAQQGTRRFALAGIVARFPIAMYGLGQVILVEAVTGSYGLAGAVSATGAVANAVGAPLLARLIDRHGQARAGRPALLVHLGAVAALILLATLDAPVATFFLAAAVAGGSFPPIGSMVRARWANAIGDPDRLHAAFSFESLADEFIYIVAPVLVTVVATGVTPAAGLGAAMVFVGAGTVHLLRQHATEPAPQHADRPDRPAAIRAPGLQVVVVTMVAVGGIFGAFEVATIAFADEHGSQAAAGPVLAAGGVSSLLAGLWYGSRRLTMPPNRQYALCIVLVSSATVVLPTVDSLLGLTLASLLLGCAISPALIAGFGLAHRLMPADGVTEGLAWISTGIGLGLALGAPVAGQIVDNSGASAAYFVCVASGVLAAATALAGHGRLRPVEAVGVGGPDSRDA